MEVIKRDMLKRGLLICVVFLSAALILTPGCAKKEPVTTETPPIEEVQPFAEETPMMEETTTPNETVSNETVF